MSDAPWPDLRDELDRWTDAGRCAEFWLRDDDAVTSTPALDRLLALTGQHNVPLLLAVIPKETGHDLAERLGETRHVSVALHGWAHQNHAPDSEKKQEFGPHRSHETMLAELDRGRRHLQRLNPERFVPVLVPPWNRIDWSLAPRLPEAGLTMLSTFGPNREAGHVGVLNSTVDIIDWRRRGGREAGELIAEILVQLRRAFEGGQGRVGLLTHHLVHDPDGWRFLDGLFEATARHQGCRWRPFSDLIRESRPQSATA